MLQGVSGEAGWVEDARGTVMSMFVPTATTRSPMGEPVAMAMATG